MFYCFTADTELGSVTYTWRKIAVENKSAPDRRDTKGEKDVLQLSHPNLSSIFVMVACTTVHEETPSAMPRLHQFCISSWTTALYSYFTES